MLRKTLTHVVADDQSLSLGLNFEGKLLYTNLRYDWKRVGTAVKYAEICIHEPAETGQFIKNGASFRLQVHLCGHAFHFRIHCLGTNLIITSLTRQSDTVCLEVGTKPRVDIEILYWIGET